jgi:cell division protein FtsB
MKPYVCDNHRDDVMVYQATYPNTACPLCQALTDLEDLRQQIEDLTTERDGLSEENLDLTAERDSLQEELGSREK